MSTQTNTIGIVGCGIIGASWARAFLRAGHAVVICDPAVNKDELLSRLKGTAATDRLSFETSIDGLVECSYVQESIVEDVGAKQALFAQIDETLPGDTVVASSTSALCMSDLVPDLAGRARFLVAHPASPPHALPAVEIVPAPFTGPECVEFTENLLRCIGQSPVRLAREVRGFALNRLQGALLLAMIDLVRDGIVSPEGVDTLLRDSFGMRWSLMGPLEGVHLNAPGGIDDYFTRYAGMFDGFCEDGRTLADVLPQPVRDALQAYGVSRVPLNEMEARRAWRDDALLALRDWRAGIMS